MKMVDDLSHVFEGYVNPHATREQYAAQSRQTFLRFDGINYYFRLIEEELNNLKSFTSGQELVSVDRLESRFEYFRTSVISEFKAMELSGANADMAVRDINSLPFRQIGRILRSVVNGTLWVDYAISEISNEFATAKRAWARRA